MAADHELRQTSTSPAEQMEALIRRILAEEQSSRPIAVVASEVPGDMRYQLAQLATQIGAVMRDLDSIKMGLHGVELNVAELKATTREREQGQRYSLARRPVHITRNGCDLPGHHYHIR